MIFAWPQNTHDTTERRSTWPISIQRFRQGFNYDGPAEAFFFFFLDAARRETWTCCTHEWRGARPRFRMSQSAVQERHHIARLSAGKKRTRIRNRLIVSSVPGNRVDVSEPDVKKKTLGCCYPVLSCCSNKGKRGWEQGCNTWIYSSYTTYILVKFSLILIFRKLLIN